MKQTVKHVETAKLEISLKFLKCDIFQKKLEGIN